MEGWGRAAEASRGPPCDLAPAGSASRLRGSRSRSSAVASQGKSRAAATQVGPKGWGSGGGRKRGVVSSDSVAALAVREICEAALRLIIVVVESHVTWTHKDRR